MKIVLPFRGEFGIMIRYHVPAVAALRRPVLVCHEPGLEALYPDCSRLLVERKGDAERRWTYEHDRDFVRSWKTRLSKAYPTARFVTPDDRKPKRKERRFVPAPWETQRGTAPVDVVVCPRRREYAAERNWDAWPGVANSLAAEGLTVFAAGLRETSYPVNAHESAWDYARPLDATIEAMRAAKLVLATDSGLAHLAMLCGTPLLIVGADGGRIGPGPWLDAKGEHYRDRLWPIKVDEYYRAANHRNVALNVAPHGWGDPDGVVRQALASLASEVAA